MGYIIIDLEFNNMQNITKYYPKIYEEYDGLKDLKLENEIIEIGAVKLDKFMRRVGEYKTYIKPKVLKVMNPKVMEITGITEENLKTGISFEEAMEEFKEFAGTEDCVLCSWATDDIAQIFENANYHNYDNIKWINKYLDIQEYCTKMLAHKKSLSLKHALEELKIKIDTTKLHDALNDAIYTGEVFGRLYNGRIIKSYIVDDVYNIPAMRVRNLKDFKLDDKDVEFKCLKCKSSVEVEHPLTLVSWRFVSLGKCKKCKSKLLKEVLVKKTLNGKIVYTSTDTMLNDIEYMDMLYKLRKNSKNNNVNNM